MKMRFSRITLLLASISFCITACSVSETDPVGTSEPSAPQSQALNPFLPGRVTVQFDDAMTVLVEEALAEGETVPTKAPVLGGVLTDLGISSLRRVFPDAGEYEPRTRREGLHRFYYVEFDESVPVTKAAGELENVPGIVSVTRQLPVRTRAFNDPYFGSQWHYVNSRYKGADINVQKVWDEFTVGDSKVIVSVVDEGVNLNHEDLQGNVVPCYEDGTGSYNFNNDTPTVVPTQGHGSHVAGIIAATSNNGLGVAGVAGGDAAKGIQGARVLSCQIFDLYGAQPDIYQAIKHGADHGAVILQCSWGFSPDMDGDGFTTDEEIALYRSYTIKDLPEYKAAIDYFIKYAGCDNDGNQLPDSPMKGGVAIFASGNDNFDYDPLVSYEPIIAVGAFGATGNKASYSNWGDWVDIAAPGGDAKQGIYSTLLGNSYGGSDWQGTSMACPHVSGVAALLVSYFGGPGFTAEECRTRLVRGAVKDFFTGSRYIGRKLDAYGAFTYNMNTPAQAPELAWTGETPAEIAYNEYVEVPFTVTDPERLEVKVELTAKQQGVSILKDYDQGWRLAIDGTVMNPGEYTATLRGTNEDNLSHTLSLNFRVLSNRKPVVLISEPEPVRFASAEAEPVVIDLGEWFSDPDNDVLNYSAQLSVAGIISATVVGQTLTLRPLASGATSLEVRASDGHGSASVSFDAAVSDPAKPVYAWPTQASTELHIGLGAGESVTVKAVIYSASGSEVLSWEGSGDVFHPLTLDVSTLAPGQYLLKVSYPGTEQTLRFVKI